MKTNFRTKILIASVMGFFFFGSGHSLIAAERDSLSRPIIRATAVTIQINPATLPNGTVGTAYTQTLTATGSITTTSSWNVSGTLPPGISLSTATGTTNSLKGTPLTAGTYSFTIKVVSMSSSGGSSINSSATRNYQIKITAALLPTPVPTPTPAPTTPTPPAPPVTGNLILNPNLETATANPNIPDHWNQGGYDDIATFTYPASGQTGAGAKVAITTHTDGDAKWYFDDVPVTPNAMYSFTDAYNANVPSTLVARFTATDNSVTYPTLITLSPTNGAWATTPKQTIVAPANAAKLTIFHLINSVGSLTTDNYSLTLISGTGSGTLSKGLLSLTFDDGWLSQYTKALPLLKSANMPASFYIISDAMLNSEETIFPSTNNPLNAQTTSKSVTWPQIYSDPNQHAFSFTDKYTATGPSTITVEYTPVSGVQTSVVVGTLPAGTNAHASFNFTLPQFAPSAPMTIVHALTGATGTLTATNPLLTEAIGYMNSQQVLELQTAGMEIGDHTLDHCNLATLFANPSSATIPPSQAGSGCPDTGPLAAPTTAQQEIAGARTALQSAGATPVLTFAYPYGAGAGVAGIESLVQTDGMIAARSVNAGYNTKTTDPFNLNTQLVDITVTDFATAKAWIDHAIANKVWLILTFHQVEDSAATLSGNGEVDGTTTAMVQSIITYAAQQQTTGKLAVGTVHDIMVQYMQ